MRKRTIKAQVINSLEKFIENNVVQYNGFVPMNDLEYSINEVHYHYESPYFSKFYSDRIAFEYIKAKYGIIRVRDLCNDCYGKLTDEIHGNSTIFFVENFKVKLIN